MAADFAADGVAEMRVAAILGAATIVFTTIIFTTIMFTMTWHSVRAEDAGPIPQRVEFPSADGRTILVGYLYKPPRWPARQLPAVVMMHGRGGPYSTLAKGRYDATTLSLRHKAWGRTWAEAGYLAILVDGFGPRGYPKGFPRFSYENRPAELNEVTVRPHRVAGLV